MKKQLIINVGLDVTDAAGTVRKSALSERHVVETLRGWIGNNSIFVDQTAIHTSDTESTLVLSVFVAERTPLLWFAAAAAELGQDCIAVFDPSTGVGNLLGPRAEKWGAFNPEFFLTLSGARLSEENARDRALLADLRAL
jgi:hypothetical protein